MSESRADLTLASALRVMEPLAELLLREGVTYPRFANALKTVFLKVARQVLESSVTRVNDSSISALTGIHRKDVRQWRALGRPQPQARTFGAVMEVFTRWANDPAYCDGQGHPRVLERTGGAGTFDALAAATSNDVHPHTLLRELIRLGIAQRVENEPAVEGDRVRLCVDALVPHEGLAEMLELFSGNVGDHLAAAAHNLAGGGDPMLEQSVYADGLRGESVAAMNGLARRIWSNAFHEIVRDATVLSDQDKGQADADQRLRIGMYFYCEPNPKT